MCQQTAPSVSDVREGDKRRKKYGNQHITVCSHHDCRLQIHSLRFRTVRCLGVRMAAKRQGEQIRGPCLTDVACSGAVTCLSLRVP